MNTDELRQAFIFGFAKGIKGDDQDLNTTCPCCDKPMTFGDLPHMVVEGIGDLLDVHLDAPPGVLANLLADYVAEALAERLDSNKAVVTGYVVGEEAMDRARILDLRDDE